MVQIRKSIPVVVIIPKDPNLEVKVFIRGGTDPYKEYTRQLRWEYEEKYARLEWEGIL